AGFLRARSWSPRPESLKPSPHPLYLRPLAGVAQLVEQRIRNARVGSSNLFSGTIFCQERRATRGVFVSAQVEHGSVIEGLARSTATAPNQVQAAPDPRTLVRLPHRRAGQHRSDRAHLANSTRSGHRSRAA